MISIANLTWERPNIGFIGRTAIHAGNVRQANSFP